MALTSETLLVDLGAVGEGVGFALYSEVKIEELGLTEWEPDERLRLLRTQFEARRRGYSGAVERVIIHDGVPAGWLTIDEDGSAVRCVDLAIRPGARGRGLGTDVLRGLQRRAAALDLPLVLSVLRTNLRARSLYDRLGFHETGGTDTHAYLEWRP